MGVQNIVYVNYRLHLAGCMKVRDEVFKNKTILPSSTLMLVSGFTKLKFKVKIEVLASAF